MKHRNIIRTIFAAVAVAASGAWANTEIVDGIEWIYIVSGGEAEVGVETNLPASVAITKLAATTLPAAKSDWKDYATLTVKERALCRFFKLKAELD